MSKQMEILTLKDETYRTRANCRACRKQVRPKKFTVVRAGSKIAIRGVHKKCGSNVFTFIPTDMVNVTKLSKGKTRRMRHSWRV